LPDQDKNCIHCLHTKICPFANQIEATVMEFSGLYLSEPTSLQKVMVYMSIGLASGCENYLPLSELKGYHSEDTEG